MKKILFGALALVLLYCFYSLPSKETPKIYDCFLFNDELELLEMRLSEMSNKVDYFVIAESSETFRGTLKPLHFEENRERFKKYLDKIKHVPIKEAYVTSNAWERERYQRDQLMRGLTSCKQNDIILLSDVDEIVRVNKIEEIKNALWNNKEDLVVLGQTMYVGYLNRLHDNGDSWYGTVAVPYKTAKKLYPTKMRKLTSLSKRKLKKANIKRYSLIENAGWHFSSMGGIERFIKKIEAFSHSEWDTKEQKNPEALSQLIRTNTLVSIDETYPQYVIDNEAFLTQAGFIEK